MSILDSPATRPSQNGLDEAAIAELHTAFSVARQAFEANRNPTLSERRGRIEALIHMMLHHRERISAALSDDFGTHPIPTSDLIEVLGVVERAKYVLEHLEERSRPVARETDRAVLGNAIAYIQHQPKGVVGNKSRGIFPSTSRWAP
jgi:coniferyl-aldehyde dehydrogenase